MAPATVLSILKTAEVYLFQWHSAARRGPATAYALLPRNPGVEQRVQEQFAELAHLFNRFVQPDSQPFGDEGSARLDPLQSVGRFLFAQLLPPIIQQALRTLAPGDALTIATNDPAVPWELMHDGESYLALKFALARQLLTQQPRLQPSQPRHTRWATLLIGNPTGDLPQASQEIEQLAQLLEGVPETARPRLLLRHRATRALVLQELSSGRYDLIHYSGHAHFDATQPAATGLILADGEVLTLQEIEQHLSGQPVIFLNGCESARGLTLPISTADDEAGLTYLGVAAQGLATAFIGGGAQAFIGAFWPILDAGSQSFALTFYRLATQGVALDEALRRTRELVRAANPQNPLWASYSLYGDPTLPVMSASAYAIRPVTVVAAQIAGVPALYQAVGLERATALEQNFLAQVAETAHAYGGEVVAATLPLLQIRFGLPTAQEDNAVRALHTALALRPLLQQLNPTSVNGDDPGLYLRCGISSDQVLTRQAGDGALRLSSNVSATALELALGAEAGEIRTDEATRRQAQRTFHFEPVAQSAAEPPAAQIWRVHQPLQPFNPPDAPMPMIGRERELKLLTEWWEEVGPGVGRLVGLVGAPGVGKTRLVQALQHHLRHQPHHWIQATCHVFGQDRIYAVLAQILAALAQITPDDDEATQRIKLTELVRTTILGLGHRLEDHLDDTLALAGRVIGLHFPAPAIDTLDPELRQKRLVGIGQAVLGYQARRQPLVLVLDDLQWADEASLAVLQPLINSLSQLPILVLAIHRPEWSAGWTHSPHYRHLPLGLLSPAAQRTLLADLLQTTVVPEALAQSILQRTGGNPFFISEVVLALQESAALVYTPDGWAQAASLEGIPLPETIESLLQARLDRLSAVSREVLDRAAVIGPEFDHQVLAAVQDEPVRRVLERSVNELTQRDFIQTAFGFTLNYAFSHGLIHQTVYSRLLEQARRVFHRLVAQVYQRLYGERDVERLAHHYYHSNDRLQAIRYCLAAAQHAADQWSNSTAIRWYERALEWLQSFATEPPSENEEQQGATPTQLRAWQVAALEGRAEVQAAIGQNESAIAGYQAALALITNDADLPSSRQAALYRKLAIAHHDRGELDAAWTALENGLRSLNGAVTPEAGRLQIWRGMILVRRGQLHEGLAAYEAGIASVGNRDAVIQDLSKAYNLAGIIYRRQGRLAEAMSVLQANIEQCQAANYLPGLARAYSNLGSIYQDLGRWDEVLQYNLQSAELSSRTGDVRQQASVAIDMGEIYRERGQLDQAIQAYADAQQIGEQFAFSEITGMALINQGAIYLKQDKLTETERCLQAGRNIFYQHGIELYWSEVFRYFAGLYLKQGELRTALNTALDALQWATDQDEQLEIGLTHRILGQIYHSLGQLEDAKSELEKSLIILEQQNRPYEIGLTLLEMALCYHTLLTDEPTNTVLEQQAISFCDQAIEIFKGLDTALDWQLAQSVRQRFRL